MTWDVEVWHDTTMWNEGFEYARQPYTVVRVADEKAAQLVADAVRFLNRTAGDDKQFATRANPSNPNSMLGMLGAAQAVGFVQGAISMWEGL